MKKALVVLSIISAASLSGCAMHAERDIADNSSPQEPPQKALKRPVTNITGTMTAKRSDQQDGLNHYYRNNQPQVDAFGAVRPYGVASAYADNDRTYYGKQLTKHIGDYVRNLTQNLVGNMEYVSDKTPVGVTHFALLDSDLQKTNLLGFQLAESFMHELHQFRIPVLDYKSTDYIRVTEEGDFILSRDFLELEESAPLDYVLTGTLARHQGGYLVNARILGLESKAVVASSQTLIPYHVVEAILPSEDNRVDGVKLVEGE